MNQRVWRHTTIQSKLTRKKAKQNHLIRAVKRFLELLQSLAARHDLHKKQISNETSDTSTRKEKKKKQPRHVLQPVAALLQQALHLRADSLVRVKLVVRAACLALRVCFCFSRQLFKFSTQSASQTLCVQLRKTAKPRRHPHPPLTRYPAPLRPFLQR